MQKLILIIISIFIVLIGMSILNNQNYKKMVNSIQNPVVPTATPIPNPLNIKYMRSQNYSGSDIKIEETLADGNNYKRYIVSFYSGNLKEYAYMTIPKTSKPLNGYPVIIFNHGYQTPELYTPDGNYIVYMDAFATNGYIVFKPDYRGNGKSEGAPTSAYFSPDYAIDVLNAISSVKTILDANPNKIGIWGHSMGGNITLRVSEVSKDIKAIVIWGGVVGNYNDIIYNWQNRVSYQPAREDLSLRNLNLNTILAENGTPSENPNFWNSIDPYYNLNYINAPIQLHVGLSDQEVPPDFSFSLFNKLKESGKNADYFEYTGANHDIAQGFNLAMQRTLLFFDNVLKKDD